MDIAGHSIGVGSNYIQEGLVMDLRNFVLGKADFPEGAVLAEKGYTIDLCGTWIGDPAFDASSSANQVTLNGQIWTLGFILNKSNSKSLNFRIFNQEAVSSCKRTERFSLAFSVLGNTGSNTRTIAYANGKAFDNRIGMFNMPESFASIVLVPSYFGSLKKIILCDRFSVYGRELSAEEIARNHAVDIERFGI